MSKCSCTESWKERHLRLHTAAPAKLSLYKHGIKSPTCEDCGVGGEWNGKQLTLQLDHVNGDPWDNRLENLRILCPNCHSQTETFCGKNMVPSQLRQARDELRSLRRLRRGDPRLIELIGEDYFKNVELYA